MSRVSRKPIGLSAAAWYYGPLGFGSTRGSFPSPDAIRSADKAQALVASGLCPGCGQSKDVERESVWCAKCYGKEEA